MFVSMIALFGCFDVAEDKVEAKVEDVPEEAAAKVGDAAPKAPEAFAPQLPGEVWPVDTSSSKVEALAAKVLNSHPILFHDFDGKVSVADGKVAGIAFEVDMASLEADVPKLTAHLKNEDFFDVPKHPKSTFVSTSVSEGSDIPDMSHTVVGTFDIHGHKKKVTFPASISLSDGAVSAKTEFALNREDFGLTYQVQTADNLIQDKVVLTVELKASKPGV